MKTLFTILFLLVASLSLAQYPPELQGDPAVVTNHEVLFVEVEQHQIPWSVPPPNPDLGWRTSLTPQLYQPWALVVDVDCLYHFTNETCIVNTPGNATTYVWDAGSYQSILYNYPDGDRMIDAYVLKPDGWHRYTGLLDFQGHPPQFFDWLWYVGYQGLMGLPDPYVQPPETAQVQ